MKKQQRIIHDFIYFYKDKNKNNIPILTGSDIRFESIIWLDLEQKKKIFTNWEKSKNNLFVFVDGMEFKLA
ncbi:hypothetical protein [Liquorilactobacillus cacaonum]|uniref:Uncharacterized protein n=1 Tax=Liquorilactobacillus cacaonum DSM 21116 TaxID=1423729 RepID=A0A0R2CT88_9LACO|nr:hypothetical protein [Liquorilactobacillus cacaonum]KRM91467.1 hypothetical protein FC80_GL000433 [Liquorilactobacillus cacaonum DSM 21116]